MKSILSIISIFVVLLSFSESVLADEHLVFKNKRQYFGRVSKLPDTEIWASKDKLYVSERRRILIFDFRQSKKVILSKDKQRFRELQIDQSIRQIKKVADSVLMKYTPRYTWTFLKTGKDTIVNGSKCKQYTGIGLDEFSEINANLCIAAKVPRILKYFLGHYKTTDYFNDPHTQDFYKNTPFGTSLVVRRKDSVTPPNPIPESYWIETILETVEEKPAPSGIYDIPLNARKVDKL